MWWLIGFIVGGLFAPDPTPAFARPPAEPCPPGRYLVDAPSLLDRGVDAGAIVTVTAGGEVEVSGICAPTPARRLKARRKATKVKARWERCGDLSKVRLALRVRAPECTEARGVLKAKRTRRSRFHARRLPACNDLQPSEAAIQAAVDAALAGLTDPWSDPVEFRAMITGIEARLGCSFGWLEARSWSASAVGRLKPPQFQDYDPTVSYCGKGTSLDKLDLTLRGDSNCLNHACFSHDVCYYERCVQTTCLWSAQSTPCDEGMFSQCDNLPGEGGCRGGSGWSVTDVAICKIAKGADALQSAVNQESCNEPPCKDGACNPDTGTCETTTTSVSSTTVTTAPTTTVTSVTSTTATSTTIGPLGGIQVVPHFACIAPGATQQLEAFVEGVANPTVTWTRAVGYGSVDAGGLYQSLSVGTSDAVITAEAAEVPGALDWANIHVSQCNCSWSAAITGPTTWGAAGWYDVFVITAGSLDLLFEQDNGPFGEPRPGIIGVGFVGPTPLPGETGSFRAGFVFDGPDGSWNALQDDPDVAVYINVLEYTGDTMRGSVTGTAARRDNGELVDVADVNIQFEGTSFSGETKCE